ncbi:hypothetical protein PV516_18690 [Streptomyces scabiei]|uniref:hypothetical protein n=1 Tax=Streptomyces scabiei TaxID=1930 RepID=UPI0029A8FA67|nr:hypothetical protein [Streptomyces scabiei]MDX3165814.1 hypothetical protein [Streptomyces scabiei]
MSSIDIGARLARIERHIAGLQRASRLSHASLEDTALQVYDGDGSLRAVIGQQSDGSSGVVVVNGPPPPQPSAPSASSTLGGVSVTWDGTFTDALSVPLDFARTEVHAAATADFTPGPGTLRATLESPQGGTVLVPAGQAVYVRLLARTTSGTASTPSAQRGPVGPAAVVAQDVLDGIVNETKLADEAVSRIKLQIGAVGYNQLAIGTGNLMPDPSFEGAFTEQLITQYTLWRLVEGNNSPRALRVDGTSATPASPSLPVTELPVSPGDRFFLAFDYRVSADWAGNSVRFYLRWQDAAGAVLGYGTAIATPTPGAAWARASTQVQAPAGTVAATVWLQNFQGTAGTADFDNAQIGTVVAAGMVLAESIGTLELAAGAVTADKVTAKTLTAREVKALSLTGDEIATNTLVARHIAAGAVNATHLAIGVNGNLVADPSYETGYIASFLTSVTYAAVVDGGNNSPKCLRLIPAASQYMWLQHPIAPVLPGEKYWLAADYKATADLTGGRVQMYMGFYDEAGTRLSSDGVSITAPVVDGTWQRLTKIVTIPAGASRANIRVGYDATSSATVAGTLFFDNLEIRPLLSTPGTGARAEVSPQGLRLYDEDGEEAVSLVTGNPNYLTLRTNGTSVATIDQAGNAGFADLAVAGDLTVGGDPVSTLLDALPRGLVAVNFQTATRTSTATEMGFVELPVDIDTSRMYRFVFEARANPSVLGGELQLRLRDGGTAAPTITSKQIHVAVHHMPLANSMMGRLETVKSGATLGAGLHRFLLTFVNALGPSGQTCTLYGGSGAVGHFYVEDVGPALPATGGYNAGGGTEAQAPKTYTKTYAASWSGSYASRSAYNSYYGSQCLQGYYSSTNGMQAALIGFPAALATDLAGATITKAQVYLYFSHWYNNSGGKAVIRAHKHASRPSTFSSDSEAQTISWAKNVGKWVDITAVFDSTSWRGIALDPNNLDKAYYGRAMGVGETYPPKLKVTYVK